MKYRKIYYTPLSDAYLYSMIFEDLKDPDDSNNEQYPYLFQYYNDNDKLIKEIQFQLGREAIIKNWTYNEDKLMSIKTEYLETSGSILVSYRYDEQIIEEIRELDGGPDGRIIRYFDKSGKLTHEEAYAYQNELLHTSSFNQKGDVISQKWANGNCLRFEYDYDEQGNLLVSRDYDNDTLHSETRYSYILGKLREQSTWHKEELDSKIEYQYGNNDKIKWIKETYPQKNVSIEYEFNSQGKKIKEQRNRDNVVEFEWEMNEYPEIQAELSVFTQIQARSNRRTSTDFKVSGKREVMLDEENRPIAELLSNYKLHSGEPKLIDGAYYIYEYGNGDGEEDEEDWDEDHED